MNEAEFHESLEANWRRRLSPAEEAKVHAWLAKHPERRAEWEAESGLGHLLDQLPDAPVPSNFTARVLQAARREAARPVPRPFLAELWQRLFPRPAAGVAWAVVMLCLSGLAIQQSRQNAREQRAAGLAALGRAAGLSDPNLLADFDAIRHLPQPDDEELFVVLTHNVATQ